MDAGEDWLFALEDGGVLTTTGGALPGSGRALALAPHPDDPDAVAVTLKRLADGGWDVGWLIVTGGWSGVDDAFVGPDRAAKTRAREAEQRASAQLFGLPPDRLRFARLEETAAGELADTEEGARALHAILKEMAPRLVVLPCRNDTNATHRLVYTWLEAWAVRCPMRVTALGNEDPKTTDFRADLRVVFGPERAAWKAALLGCHASQTARNQRTRGCSFAERILATNRKDEALAPGEHAERFQVQVWPARLP